MINVFKYSAVVAGLTFLAAHGDAGLLFTGVLPSSGNGIGAVNTSLTFQNTGAESGCVAFNGTTSTTGSAACPAGFTGGDEKSGSSQTNVFTAAQLGFTPTNNFSNLVVIFNGDEGGNAADQVITLNSLGLSLYSASGSRLATYTSPSLPLTFAALPGVGNAGFAFALDSTEAAQANGFLVTNPLLRVGAEANVTMANGGPETVQLTTVTNTGLGGGPGSGGLVPEPETVLMLSSGLALICISPLRKRFAR